MKFGKYLVGLISGATFGVLFAPKKGKKLRNEILKNGGKSGQDALAILVKAFKAAGMDAVDEVKKMSENDKLGDAIGSSKKMMKTYLIQLEKTGYDIATRAQEHLGDFTDMAEEATAKFKKRTTTKKNSKSKKRTTSSRPKAKAPSKVKTAPKKIAPKKSVKKVLKAVKKPSLKRAAGVKKPTSKPKTKSKS